MKTNLLLLLTALSLQADTNQIQNLGSITPRRSITLMRDTRDDWVKYEIEFRSLPPSTNRTTVTLTNDLVTLEVLATVPSGPAIMGVRSVYEDGETSDASVFRVSIWRGKPRAPSAKPTFMSAPKGASIKNDGPIDSARVMMPIRTNAPPPLPMGVAGTYGDLLDRNADDMIKHYRKSGRRNQ